ncbi:MAG: ABC transporter permease, partial [Deltaproteobacteria bacterium]
MFLSSLNTPAVGTVELSSELTLKNYTRFFSRSSYLIAEGRSLLLASIVSFLSLLIAYPTAFLIARTEHPGRVTFLTLLVLIAMQLDIVIRLYGMMVILGDNGLVNQMLLGLEIISKPLPLMYNFLGVVFGLVQFALPFMILTLVGVLRGIDPSLEEAARSLGANRFRCFFRVTLPASMPGILAGTLLVFALSVSSYIVPALMGGFRVGVLPIHIFQQVMQMAQFQFGAAVGVVLFLISLTSIAVYLRVGSSARGA